MADKKYQQWLADLKEKIRNSQMKAALKVNTEMLALYWEIGKELTEKQAQSTWGDKIISQLAKDLNSEFPEIKGFSATNLKYIRKWFQFYTAIGQQTVDLLEIQSAKPPKKIGQQADGQTGQQPACQFPAILARVPWGHHIQIITKVAVADEAVFYVHQTAANNWSRSVLLHQIDSGLYHRKGKAITNFELTLPKAHSDLARETLKSPYIFDFLGLTDEVQERELEKALIQHIKKFMLELGRGFAYVGNQYKLWVEDDEYFLDLLFFNYQLDCFVVFELKVGEFKPEFTGKLNFYINTIDEQIKSSQHKPTIGVLLCRTSNETVVKYALKGIDTPMGVAGYEFTKALPNELKGEIPTIEELEREIEKEIIEFKENLSPVDARLQSIKEKLSGIKTEEIQTPYTYSALIKVYTEGLKPLYRDIIERLSSFDEEFHSKSYGWNGRNSNFQAWEQLDAFWSNEENFRHLNDLEFFYNLTGFKKAGTESYSEYLSLKFVMQQYWYGFTLVNHNNQEPILKKLYHEPITKEDRQLIVDLLMTKVMDRIDWILEIMGNNKNKSNL